jgi:hypothetical protein
VDKLFLLGVQLRYDPQFHIHQWNPNSETFFYDKQERRQGEAFNFLAATVLYH